MTHFFRDPSLLEQALTHSSYANEHGGIPHNERLEFLGDAVVELVVTELLLAAHPGWPEGLLSRARSRIVDAPTLAELADAAGLTPALRIANHQRPTENVRGDLFEAVAAAVYLDGGLEAARAFLVPLLAPRVDALAEDSVVDPRSALQEWLDAHGHAPPVYRLVERRGPPHQPVFVAEVEAAGRSFGPAEGTGKRKAFAAAAALALDALR